MALSNADRQQRHRDKLLRYVTETRSILLTLKQEVASLRNELVLRYVTPPDPLLKNLPSEDESYKKETNVHAVARTAFSQELFNEFWDLWPTRIGKAPARKAFPAALGKASLTTILDGVRTYVRCKPADRPWLNPATWLHQERWNDEFATKPNGHAVSEPDAVQLAEIEDFKARIRESFRSREDPQSEL
jgi:hypothetical protein